MTERTRIILVVSVVVAVAAVLLAAFLPLRSGTSRLLPPVPEQLSGPPLVPAPVTPSAPTATGSDVPGEPPVGPSSTAAPSAARTPPRRVPVSFRTVSFEAESAANTLSGDTHVRAASGASGGLAIGAIGGDRNNTLRFNNLVVPVTGTYTLTVFYLSGETRSLAIVINGGRVVTAIFPPTGDDFDIVGSLTLRITLVGGSNSLTFGNAVNHGPDIDRITLGS